MIVYDGITGVDVNGKIPDSILLECRLALSALQNRLKSDGLTTRDILRLVYAVHDGEIIPACQMVLAGWFEGGANPVFTMRLQTQFPQNGQRLLLSATAMKTQVGADK